MASYYSKGLDTEHSAKRQKSFHDEVSEENADSKIIKSQEEDPSTAEDLIDSEIIQHQQQQEEQEKAAEEQRKGRKRTSHDDKSSELRAVVAAAAAAISTKLEADEANDDGSNGSSIKKDDQTDSQDGSLDPTIESPSTKDRSHQSSLSSSLLAATASNALRSGANGQDSLVPQPLTPVPSHTVSSPSHHGLQSTHNSIPTSTSGLQTAHHDATNSATTHLAMAAANQYAQQQQLHAQHQHQALAQQGNVMNPQTLSPPKPPVGSDEWHRQRRDNHKEVERRRRETINEGIRELAEIVPRCDKNKGQILRRAVEYIRELREAEAEHMEKWTLEKLLSEQAISEYSATNDKLKNELELAWREVAAWKKACTDAGIMKPAEL